MKKVFVLLIAMLFLVICSGCSNQEDSSNSADSGTAEPAAAEKDSKPASVAAGDMMTFGRYEQDSNLNNGPEPIEWMVLDVQDGKALLLSKYGLDAQQYNAEWRATTWENCTLRAWLNSDFLNGAFSTEEQSAILVTEVDNSDAQGFDWTKAEGGQTTGGNNTEDKIFLLSCAEAIQYFDTKYMGVEGSENNVAARVSPTKYALNNGAYVDENDYQIACKTSDGNKAGWWWLRSPGDYQGNAAAVSFYGSFASKYSDNSYICIRPALWVNLDSGIF